MLAAGLVGMLASQLPAQTFKTLYSFTEEVYVGTPEVPYPTNSDGATRTGELILSGNSLYGAANRDGSSGGGTIFAVNTDGTAFTVLHSFTDVVGSAGLNSDGFWPNGLALSGSIPYGTAFYGGDSKNGTIFALNTDGSRFTTLHSFTEVTWNGSSWANSDGAGPSAGLILFGNTLYGTTKYGGDWNNGTVFAVNTDGTDFKTLHSFTSGGCTTALCPNTDGALPLARLLLSGDTLYGTTAYGGSSGDGTVFKLQTDGTGFKTLHSFTANCGFACPNSDGSLPKSGVVLSGNTLYGTAQSGGRSNSGTVFAVNTDGTGFRTLHSFEEPGTGDGHHGLILSGSNLYGTTYGDTAGERGTVFVLNTNGTAFTVLHRFTTGFCASVASLK